MTERSEPAASAESVLDVGYRHPPFLRPLPPWDCERVRPARGENPGRSRCPNRGSPQFLRALGESLPNGRRAYLDSAKHESALRIRDSVEQRGRYIATCRRDA